MRRLADTPDARLGETPESEQLKRIADALEDIRDLLLIQDYRPVDTLRDKIAEMGKQDG